MSIVCGERRSGRRFEMQLRVHYEVTLNRGRSRVGGGTTINLSRGGVLFRSYELLPIGRPVELSIDWPILMYGVEPVELVLMGRVVWAKGGTAAVRTQSYEFRRRADAVSLPQALTTESTHMQVA